MPLSPGSIVVRTLLVRGMLSGGIDGDQPVITICSNGPRAAIAASILSAQGIEARPVLHGGVADWQSRGNETVGFRRCGT